MSDLFEGEDKGEVVQLRDQLDSNDESVRKKAAKRVVSLMRSGEDVGSLFPSMMRCVKTKDIELKRLTYLYLIKYSNQQTEESIMVVNTFVQDSNDFNPLVRALAVRSMCRIRIESVAEYMIDPLKITLKDKDPFVRKTAALGVAKLFDVIPDAIENAGIFSLLFDLLSDENPMVISNTMAAICEINEKKSSPIFVFTPDNVQPLLSALSSSSEWCQTVLLDSLSLYEPQAADEASNLIDRVSFFLKTSNPAVIISSFKCVLAFIDFSDREPKEVFQTVMPPFISLVSSAEPAIQYVVLRTLSIFSQKYPGSLVKYIRIFFCKYNDPYYVKMEKLDILMSLSSESSASILIDELNEYCNAVDVGFVRKSIKCIGQLALRIDTAAPRCVDVLMGLIESKAEYSAEESIIVFADILRKYPGKFESVISKVCSAVETIKDPNAKASMIWILGEYNSMIEKVDVLLDPFLDEFHDESPEVQLQLITAIVKVYLNSPAETKDQLQFILTEATKDTNLPDVRNRALIYWRLLSVDSSKASSIIQFSKAEVEHSGAQYSDEILSDILTHLGSVSGIFHLPSSSIQPSARSQSSTSFDFIDVDAENNESLQIQYDWTPTAFLLKIKNISASPITDLALAVNINKYGISTVGSQTFPKAIMPSEFYVLSAPFRVDSAARNGNDKNGIDIAIKSSAGVFYFTCAVRFDRMLIGGLTIKRQDFLRLWKESAETSKFSIEGSGLAGERELKAKRMFVVARKDNEACLYFSFGDDKRMLADVEISGGSMMVTVKGDSEFARLFEAAFREGFCS